MLNAGACGPVCLDPLPTICADRKAKPAGCHSATHRGMPLVFKFEMYGCPSSSKSDDMSCALKRFRHSFGMGAGNNCHLMVIFQEFMCRIDGLCTWPASHSPGKRAHVISVFGLVAHKVAWHTALHVGCVGALAASYASSDPTGAFPSG